VLPRDIRLGNHNHSRRRWNAPDESEAVRSNTPTDTGFRKASLVFSRRAFQNQSNVDFSSNSPVFFLSRHYFDQIELSSSRISRGDSISCFCPSVVCFASSELADCAHSNVLLPNVTTSSLTVFFQPLSGAQYGEAELTVIIQKNFVSFFGHQPQVYSLLEYLGIYLHT